MSNRAMKEWKNWTGAIGRGVSSVASRLRSCLQDRGNDSSAASEADDRVASRRRMLAALGSLPVLGAAPLARAATSEDKATKVDTDAMTEPTRIVINKEDSDEYYRLRGCDVTTGIPLVSKLRELGLEDIAADLAQRGLTTGAD